jgi:hypothetical protein
MRRSVDSVPLYLSDCYVLKQKKIEKRLIPAHEPKGSLRAGFRYKAKP